LVIVDKDGGMTSHDVVARMRRLAQTRKVGHAGTLDPMATGVLVLGIEKATRLLHHLALTDKTYTATIRLGESTTTDDAEGEITSAASAAQIGEDEVRAAMLPLTGDIMQVPSSVSAIKVNGQRAYKLAREGEAVELKARPVTVSRFEAISFTRVGDVLDLEVEVDCSSGTYIRALARDLGASLGVGGHLTALRRTRVGPFTLDQARPLPEMNLIPLADAVRQSFSVREVSEDEAKALSYGKTLAPHGIAGIYGAFAPDGSVVALLSEEAGSAAKPVLVFTPAG
jgi:tRNA pseudouridine55 synthase